MLVDILILFESKKIITYSINVFPIILILLNNCYKYEYSHFCYKQKKYNCLFDLQNQFNMINVVI